MARSPGDAVTEPDSDNEILLRSLDEPECFAALFDRHSDEIFRYLARRLGPDVAEDATAETFLTAFRKRHRYDTSRLDVRPWLYGIATNIISEHRRAERRHQRAMERLADDPAAEPFEEGAARRVAAYGLRKRLTEVLGRLSAAERDVLVLIAWSDLTYEEAAQALGVPVGTIRSRLHRVRKKVRKALGDTAPAALLDETLK